MPINQNDLKKHLKKFSQDALILDIVSLFGKFENVQEYYNVKFSTESSQEVIVKYKKIIKKHLLPDRDFLNLNLREAKKAISDYKKLNEDPHLLIDLMLYYVEMGIECTSEYGDMYESFYNSMESVFERACKLIKHHKLQGAFAERCKTCCENVSDMGWGFYDGLCYSLHKYLNLNPES